MLKILILLLITIVVTIWNSKKKKKQNRKINILKEEAESLFKAEKHAESIEIYKEILNIEFNIIKKKNWTAAIAYKNIEESDWEILNRIKEIYDIQGLEFNLNEWKVLSNELKLFRENKKMVRHDGSVRRAGKTTAKKIEEQLILLYNKL